MPGFVLRVLEDQTVVLMFAQQVLHPLNHAPCSLKVAGFELHGGKEMRVPETGTAWSIIAG